MQTFDETIANFTTPQERELAEVRKTFTTTLVELRDLHRAYQKQKPALLSRVSKAQARQQRAAAKGARLSRVDWLVEQLVGGLHGVNPGLIQGVENRLAADIRQIEGMSLGDLPNRGHNGWGTWYAFPANNANNMQAIEPYLKEL